jgi:hypothetical protein
MGVVPGAINCVLCFGNGNVLRAYYSRISLAPAAGNAGSSDRDVAVR